jgi:hypothetical protein
MDPEQRLTRIENTLEFISRTQAEHAAHMAEHAAQMAKQAAEMEKHSAAIRDLIVVSRTCLDSIQEMRDSQREVTAQIKELRTAQAFTDEKLNILIDTVDRIIRKGNGNR